QRGPAPSSRSGVKWANHGETGESPSVRIHSLFWRNGASKLCGNGSWRDVNDYWRHGNFGLSSCGNRTPHQLVFQHEHVGTWYTTDGSVTVSDDGDPASIYSIFECATCHDISLY